jgi:hypothetical protein
VLLLVVTERGVVVDLDEFVTQLLDALVKVAVYLIQGSFKNMETF